MKKKLILSIGAFLLLATLVGGLFFLFAYKASYSEGNRTGRLMKFSKKGYIFKTYEGTLDLANISRNQNGVIASTWDFSVIAENDEVAKQMDKAMTENKYVKLHYEEKYFQFSWRGDTKYFVTKVEIVHEVD
jgi:hypothetical protein